MTLSLCIIQIFIKIEIQIYINTYFEIWQKFNKFNNKQIYSIIYRNKLYKIILIKYFLNQTSFNILTSSLFYDLPKLKERQLIKIINQTWRLASNISKTKLAY